MQFYDIIYTIEDETHERLSALAERYAKINGWNERAMLQFAISAMSKADIETKIQFLEKQIVLLEKEKQKHKEEKSKQKRTYISDEEREKCWKVVNAYAEELDDVGIIVVEAGRYGFIKLVDYSFPYGFDDIITFTNSIDLFLDLWEEWFEAQLITLTQNMPTAELELDYNDMFQYLSKDKQEELMAKREYFAKKAEMWIDEKGQVST